MPSVPAAEVVLVLDEERDAWESLYRKFRREGFRVLLASNAADALSIATRFRRCIYAVVHGTEMTDMNVADFTAAVARISPRLPLLLLPMAPRAVATLADVRRLHKSFDALRVVSEGRPAQNSVRASNVLEQ